MFNCYVSFVIFAEFELCLTVASIFLSFSDSSVAVWYWSIREVQKYKKMLTSTSGMAMTIRMDIQVAKTKIQHSNQAKNGGETREEKYVTGQPENKEG